MTMKYIRNCYQIDVKAGDVIEYKAYNGTVKQGVVRRATGWLLRVHLDGRKDPVSVHPQNVLRVVK